MTQAIAVLTAADFTKALPTENYRRAVLLARAHLWTLLGFDTPEGRWASNAWTANPKYRAFHDSAITASTLGETLGGLCEGRYLKAVDAYIAAPELDLLDSASGARALAAYPEVARLLEAAYASPTVDGLSCKDYDSGGIDRHWGQVMWWLTYLSERTPAEQRGDYGRALAHFERAMAIDPQHPANLTMLARLLVLVRSDIGTPNKGRACTLLRSWGSSPSDAAHSKLEPAYGTEKKMALVLARKMECH